MNLSERMDALELRVSTLERWRAWVHGSVVVVGILATAAMQIASFVGYVF